MNKGYRIPIMWYAIGMTLLFVNPGHTANWIPIMDGKPFGISGLALIDQTNGETRFLAVHDNKKKHQARLALISVKENGNVPYVPILWPEDQDLPFDLEGLTTIPGQSLPSYLALTSRGKIFHLTLDIVSLNIKIIRSFSLPDIPRDHNLEGLAVQRIGGMLLATWAHRGKNDEPAAITWGKLDLETHEVFELQSSSFSVPWPVARNVRHISDMKVDESGVLYISAASDPDNDDGPFQTAVYVAGSFSVHPKYGQGIVFQKNENPIKLFEDRHHKIEGLELVSGQSGGLFLATDDENAGSSLYLPLRQ